LLHIDGGLSYYGSARPLENKRGRTMKDLITAIIQALVDQPEEVSVNEIRGAHTIVLEVSVAKSDMGKVIGKRGRNAQAIRTILSAASGKKHENYMLEIVD
jgi:hypothetical protein